MYTLSRLAGIVTITIDNALLTLEEMEERPDQNGLPQTQDEVLIKLSSVNSALDPVMFANADRNGAALSKFKMLIGATSAIPIDEKDDF